ncbi:UDP-N-acetylmuramoyl-L-alanyl-D-glutamate--2,6-diaminopimelate ligase [Zafaria cholistanensis]|uniref:UDP-N-acetylmuramyl-tripeptide synthetase n=1 Tax=Zafaria cholistanensis TaxID=1682741 RepID=A0A5A7NUG9_9MICC|nr:UDP-N-acetylmuramoyl-L-alanyl-D-glutamate--2,6-diaminopimelate ligase [Zafaria cholistanensis]GER24369.1 UDP-N-acetylmuramoyl-L-alanyl-D-glutamate--2,6-diaminopimelate ligase [Zafaria cholistanensis]
MDTDTTAARDAERAFRPATAPALTLAGLAAAAAAAGTAVRLEGDGAAVVHGVCLDSRAVLPGDLYAAVPGANRHGADFAAAAAAAGAAAVLTDGEGLDRVRATGLPVLVAGSVRAAVGPLAACLHGTAAGPALLGVTGTNGKTTTTYFATSLLRALGQRTGLVGTIEIVAGATRIPSVLTTPEAPQLHALMARMREAGVDTAAMEVSSHSIDYGRIGGLAFEVAGFTNLTQDHLDLHGTMEEYFASKARLFEASRTRRAVITVDDAWGRRMAQSSTARTWTLATAPATEGHDADWRVRGIVSDGLGHRFEVAGPGGALLRARTGLPGLFNVSNAALALLMVHAAGAPLEDLQRVLDRDDPLTVEVPGRMQVVGRRPAAIVDFAHNPDALQRALESVDSARPGARTIVVFGATGQRDATKRPVMGAVAARHADLVVVTDDDPHDEEPAGIRAAVLAGAREAMAGGARAADAVEVAPRAAAIAAAVDLAGPEDTILVAGRGHEVWQEVRGVNLPLDDRVELRAALRARGFLPADSAHPTAKG